MTYYVPRPKFLPTTEATFESTAGNAFFASMGSVARELPTVALYDSFETSRREVFGEPIDYDNAKKMAADAGVSLSNELYHNTTKEATQYRIDEKHEEMVRQHRIAKAPDSAWLTAGTFLSSFALQFADPINVASALIPVFGEARSAALVKSLGPYGGKAVKGAAEGVVGNALTEAIVYPARQYVGADYTMNEALTNIAMGAPFGAVLHVAPDAFRDTFRAVRRRRSTQLSQADLAEFNVSTGEMIDAVDIAASRTLDVENDAFDEVADMLRAEGIEFVDDARPANPVQALKVVAESPDTSPKARAIAEEAIAKAEAPEAVYRQDAKAAKDYVNKQIKAEARRAAKEEKQSDMLGGGKKRDAPDTRSRPLKKWLKDRGYIKRGSVAHKQLEDANVGKAYIDQVTRTKGKITTLDNVPLSEFNARFADYNVGAKSPDGTYVDLDWVKEQFNDESFGKLYRTLDEIASGEYADSIARLVDDLDYAGLDIANMSIDDIAKAINDIHGVQGEDVLARIAATDSATQAAAFRGALAQTIEGRPIDIEPILRTDEAYGGDKPTPEELAELARKYEDEESAAIDERVIEENKTEVNYEETTAKAFDQAAETMEIPFGKSTVADVLADVRMSFGKATEALLDQAKIRVVQSVDRIPNSKGFPNDIKGVKTADGTVYLVADNITKGETSGLVLHEAGVHLGMRNMLGDAEFGKLLDEISASDHFDVVEARKAVPKETKPENFAEETLAYMVENAPESNIVQSLVAAIKRWARKTFGIKTAINEHDARELAIGALRKESRLGKGESAEAMFSRSIDKTEAGDQTVLAGAEKIGDKQLAERKMNERLKPKARQKDMDVGLFGDEAKQTTLFSRKKEPAEAAAKRVVDLGAIRKEFDYAVEQAQKYPKILKDAVRLMDDKSDDALRAYLYGEKIAVDSNGGNSKIIGIDDVITELKTQNHRVLKELRKRKRVESTIDETLSNLSMHEEIALQAANAIEQKILRKKREAAFNFVAREIMLARGRKYGSFADEGLLSLITGSSMLREGSRKHVAGYQTAYLREWLYGFHSALNKEGVLKQFTGRTVERDVSYALEEMDFKNPNFDGLDADAVKIAKIMHRYQENTRLTQNKLGASINYMPGYITRQSHDSNKIRNMGADKWKQGALKWFDFEEMDMPKEGINAELDEMWKDLASGKFEAEAPTEFQNTKVTGTVNLAKNVSAHRRIIFKKRAWFEYNQECGTHDVGAAFIRGIENSARVCGLMRVMGPNPQYNLQYVIAELSKELDVAGKIRLEDKKGKIEDNLAVVDGRANVPGSVRWARIGSNLRNIMMMARLGSVVFTNVTDIPVYAANMRYEGRGNMFMGMAEAISGLARGANSGSRAEVLEHLGVMFDNFNGEVMHQFTRGAGFTQNTSAMARAYTKLNLMVPWTSRLQKSAAIGFSNYLGKASSKAFNELTPEMARIFKIHGIDAAKWDVLRQAVKDIEGKRYVVTDGIESLSDDVISKYLLATGRKVTNTTIERARERMGEDFRAMVIDRAESAALSGDKRVDAALLGNSKRGTLWGEIIRFIGQFKSFPAMMIERVLKREIYGRGYDTLGDYARNGKGEMLGLANLLVMTTFSGYVSLTLHDVLKGKTPRPLDRPATWVESMVQGGFFGIGDYMFGEYDKYSGRTFASSVAGPVAGTIDDIMDLKTALASGDKVAARALRIAQNNIPFANMFYIKPVMDYLFMYSLMESMNPGYLRRMEANTTRETGQEWLIRPSSIAR